MDMAASAIGRPVTPKHHTNCEIGGFLQDVVPASQTLPNAVIVLSAKGLEKLSCVRIGGTEFHRPVGQRHHDDLPYKGILNHIGQGKCGAQMLHVRRGQIIGDGIWSCGNLRCNKPKPEPCFSAKVLNNHLLQVNLLSGRDIKGYGWGCQPKSEPPRQQGTGEPRN